MKLYTNEAHIVTNHHGAFQHNVVVIQQPQVVHTVHPTGTSDYGTETLVLAIGVSLFTVFIGCWWSLICSIAGIALAVNVSTLESL